MCIRDRPGATLILQAVQDVRIGGRNSAAQYQYTIQSDSLDDLNEWGPKLLVAMRHIHQLTDVTSDAQNNGLAANLVIDRPTASRLGITPQAVDNVLYDGFGEREIATTFTLSLIHISRWCAWFASCCAYGSSSTGCPGRSPSRPPRLEYRSQPATQSLGTSTFFSMHWAR